MPVSKLDRTIVRKPWGRHELPQPFTAEGQGSEPIGEIWYAPGAGTGADLLVKYLFTSERLSIQVHPDDTAARRLGYASGKDEAWVVLAADPGAVIGLGLTRPCSRQELRAAALDGGIETLVDWRSVAVGDVFYLPAGTVHALGAGLVVAEVQQNVDVTFRLYDYGRSRELHLDHGIEVSNPCVYRSPSPPRALRDGREILVEGGLFIMERWSGAATTMLHGDAPIWLIPLRGQISAGGEIIRAGDVALISGSMPLCPEGGCDVLVAYAGGSVRADA